MRSSLSQPPRKTTPISTPTATTEASRNRKTISEITSHAIPVMRNIHHGPAIWSSTVSTLPRGASAPPATASACSCPVSLLKPASSVSPGPVNDHGGPARGFPRNSSRTHRTLTWTSRRGQSDRCHARLRDCLGLSPRQLTRAGDLRPTSAAGRTRRSGKNSNRVGLIRARSSRPMMGAVGVAGCELVQAGPGPPRPRTSRTSFGPGRRSACIRPARRACPSWRRIRMVSRMKPGMNR